jgi:hypothetical protein
VTATLTDVDLLADLDFEPALPCQLLDHDLKDPGDGPAVWRVFGWCPGCHRRMDMLVCEMGRRRKLAQPQHGCEQCGHCHHWSKVYTIVPLDGA